MTPIQEIRVKALELSIATLALIPDEQRLEQLAKWQDKGADPKEAIINGSKVFEQYLMAQ
jgi:hypothetical protein